MSLIQNAYRSLLIPAFETAWHRRGTFRHLRDLEESQWWDGERHASQQLLALQRLLSHAKVTCPYYRDAWREAGLNPQQVDSLDEFRNWPVVTREVLRERRSEVRSTETGLRLLTKATGGSSGVPLQFDLDFESNDRKMAAWHRGYAWAGAALGTKQLHLWGGQVGSTSRAKIWKDSIYHGLYRRKMVSSFGLSSECVEEYLRTLNRHRPEAIVAYVNPLYQFALLLEERGLKPWTPRSIVVGAEKLHDFQRTAIERVFQAPVFETYGSREFMLIGGECEKRTGFHLTMENLLVEVLDDDGQPTVAGEEGNLVITDLTNYGMPFIRYANGDRAISGWDQCTCGRGLPLLRKVVGRQLDILPTSDGRFIPGEFFPHLLKDHAAIRRFQVEQEVIDRVVLKVVIRGEWPTASRLEVEQQVRSLLGPATQFTIVEVADIPLTKAGKQRVVVSHCSPQPVAYASV